MAPCRIVKQNGSLRTVIPELTLRFEDEMIILEKWVPEKPLSAIYWDGEKEIFYVKRFVIDNPDKEENILTDHSKSYLEKFFTEYRPQAEVVFAKKRGKEREANLVISLEDFIAVKGITAMGNQLTKEKVLEINGLAPLPYDMPEEPIAEEIEVVDEENVGTPEAEENPKEKSPSKKKGKDNDEGQTKLF